MRKLREILKFKCNICPECPAVATPLVIDNIRLSAIESIGISVSGAPWFPSAPSKRVNFTNLDVISKISFIPMKIP